MTDPAQDQETAPSEAGSPEAGPSDPMLEPGAGDTVFVLENFRGPMDLLLHLVREQEVAIEDVDLARLCDQYVGIIADMDELDIDVAGEFMVMAATLMLIKSRAILPREEVDLAEEIDPADELISQLLEYRRFKTLSMALGRMAVERSQRYERGVNDIPPQPERELEEIGLWDLVGTYARLVEELDLERRFDALSIQRPLREFMRDVLGELGRGPNSFVDLVEAAGGRQEVFPVFLSVLELVKSMQVEVLQEHNKAEIIVRLREGRDESLLGSLLSFDDPTPSVDPEPLSATERESAAPAETPTASGDATAG